MNKWVFIKEVKGFPGEKYNWWEDQCQQIEKVVKIVDSFDDAKDLLRTELKKCAKDYEFFPCDEGGCSQILKFVDEDIDSKDEFIKLNNIVINTLVNCCFENEDMDFQFVDDGDWYFAFIANKDEIFVDDGDCETLKMNIHNMLDQNKDYYFSDVIVDDEGRKIQVIDFQLLKVD